MNTQMEGCAAKYNGCSENSTHKRWLTSINNNFLLLAASAGNLEEVTSLIAAGADVNFVDTDGSTALHYAVESGQQELVELLLSVVEDVCIENDDGRTPLHIAREAGVKLIIRAIERKILDNSLKILPSDVTPRQTEETKPDLGFVEATFAGDYMKPLRAVDIKSILKFKYRKEANKKLFRVYETRKEYGDLRNGLVQCKSSKIQTVFIVDVGNFQWLSLVIDWVAKKKQFCAYYDESFNTHVPDPKTYQAAKQIKEEVQGILATKLSFVELNKNPFGQFDSGVVALKRAEIISFNMGNDTEIIKELNQKLDTVKERRYFANILNEKKRTEDKVMSCLSILKDLNSCESNVEEFSFKNANILVLFLETFALEDTYIEASEAEKKQIRKMKKFYFSNCYTGIKDLDIICNARKRLLHGSKVIQPEHLSEFNGTESVRDFFQNLERYTEEVNNKIIGINEEQERIECTSFLRNVEYSIGTADDMLKVFSDFVKDLYSSQNGMTEDKLEQIMFDLTVNIAPLLEHSGEKISSLNGLRNNLIHNFQKYKSTNERLSQIKDLAVSNKSNLFKYYYAREVHSLLHGMSLHEETASIATRLDTKLKAFEEGYKQTFDKIVSVEEANSFEYVFKESLFPKKEEDVKGLVDQYFQFVTIFDQDANEEDEADDENRELSDFQKREVFEEIGNLKLNSNNFDKEYNKRRQTALKRKLIEYGIRENCFRDSIVHYIENNESFDDKTTQQLKKVAGTLSLLRNISEHCPISLLEIMSMYEKGYYEDELKTKDIPNNEKQTIIYKLRSLPSSSEAMEVVIAGKRIQITIGKTVLIMLKLFYNTYNKYQINFNNVEEAFGDKTFLNCLINADNKLKRDPKSNIEEHEFQVNRYIYVLIKKLINVNFAAPYLASLLTKIRSVSVIEKDDLLKLLENLLRNDAYIHYLNDLLDVDTAKHINMYEEVCHIILKTDLVNFGTKCLQAIVKKPKHLKGILATLHRLIVSQGESSIKVMELTLKCLELLNNWILELIYQVKYKLAEEIVDSNEVKSIYSMVDAIDLAPDGESVVLWYKLNVAKVKNLRGSEEAELSNREASVTLYGEALAILEGVPETNSPQYLLVLSRRAYTKTLLKQTEEAYNDYDYLFKKVLGFALRLDTSILSDDTATFSRRIYAQFRTSENYLRIAASSKEYAKFLNIVVIRDAMAYTKAWTSVEKSIQIYEQICNEIKCFEDERRRLSIGVRKLAKAYQFFGREKAKLKDYHGALRYYFDSLVQYNRALKMYKQQYSDYHPVHTENNKCVMRCLKSIEETYDKLGD